LDRFLSIAERADDVPSNEARSAQNYLSCAKDIEFRRGRERGSVMKFKYNSKTHVIESDDSEVLVTWLPIGPEPFMQFILSTGDKRVGFRTDFVETRNLPTSFDGKQRILRIIDLGCDILRWDNKVGRAISLVNTLKFANEAEQRQVLTIIMNALAAFGSDASACPAQTEYSDELKNRIARGELIQKASQ